MFQDDDKVQPLFKDRQTAAGLPPQPDVIQSLEELLADAKSGRIVALAFVAFDGVGNYICKAAGQAQYTAYIGGLEDLKFEIMQQRRMQLHGRPLG